MLHAPGCALLETSTNQGKEVLTKFYSMFAEFFMEPDRVHACQSVATPQQREECNHQPSSSVVTDTDDSNSDEKESAMPLLIYPEDSNY